MWCVGRVEIGKEFKFLDRLVEEGHKAYCPKVFVRRNHKWKGSISYPVPMLPGYLFVDDENVRGSVIPLKFNEKVRLLCRERRVLVVPEKEMEQLRAVEKEQQETKTTAQRLNLKDFVTIMNGFLEGKIGQIVGFRKSMAIVSFSSERANLEVFVKLSEVSKHEK